MSELIAEAAACINTQQTHETKIQSLCGIRLEIERPQNHTLDARPPELAVSVDTL